jgi:deazaflavin-dependent oxidoreductase (nitroreductase family)
LSPLVIRGFSVVHRAVVRISGGRLGTRFRGSSMILLTTTGRRTGQARTWPLLALPIEGGEGWVVAGSNGGHDRHPAWYLNLGADPAAVVMIDRHEVRVRARDVPHTERAAQYARFVGVWSPYRGYEAATDREIPVVLLEPITEPVR